MGVSLEHLLVIIHYLNVQALKLFLERKLNKIMCSSVSPPSVLLTVEPVEAMVIVKFMMLTARAYRSRIWEGWDGQDKE